MKKIIKNNLEDILITVIIMLVSWIAITNVIQACKCPLMTQTELFIHIPKTFVCDWKECD